MLIAQGCQPMDAGIKQELCLLRGKSMPVHLTWRVMWSPDMLSYLQLLIAASFALADLLE
jgi:hypothetical protein